MKEREAVARAIHEAMWDEPYPAMGDGVERALLLQCADAVLAALGLDGTRVIVPVVPTARMSAAGNGTLLNDPPSPAAACYRAMLAAASPAAQETKDEG